MQLFLAYVDTVLEKKAVLYIFLLLWWIMLEDSVKRRCTFFVLITVPHDYVYVWHKSTVQYSTMFFVIFFLIIVICLMLQISVMVII